MTAIRVVPDTVRITYRDAAQGYFDSMRNSLESLVSDVVNVRYVGPNATTFKTNTGTLAADFANKLHADIAGMAEAVRASTSAIAQSLGGGALTLNIDARPIVAQAPASDGDTVDVDTTALSDLRPVITSRFTALGDALDGHLGALRATDWTGNAKENAVLAVQTYTTSARSKCDEAQRQINEAITAQIDSVTRVDV